MRGPGPAATGSSGDLELDARELAEDAPRLEVAPEVHDLVVRAAELEPAIHARPDAGVRAEVAVRHLEMRQLVGVEHLALGDDEPEALAAERHERGERRGPGLVLEEERRRVGHAADA